MPIHPGHLRPHAAPRTAGAGTVCRGCGYELRGLSAGTTCPECGLPSYRRENIDDPLACMPREVILTFRSGCWLASACVVGLGVLVVVPIFQGLDTVERLAGAAVLSVVWCVACWLLTPAFDTPQAEFQGFSKRSRLRRAARWLALAWPLHTAFVIIQATATTTLQTSPMIASLVHQTIIASFGVAFVGMIAMLLMVQRLASWARDKDADAALNLALWGIPAAWIASLLPMPILGIGLLLGLVWLVCAAALPYGLISLARSVSWSLRHAREHDERLRRQEQRRAEYDRDVANRIRRIDGGDG